MGIIRLECLMIVILLDKACICLCVDNLRRGGSSPNDTNSNSPGKYNADANNASHLTPVEITEMVFTLFCFLKDSATLSQVNTSLKLNLKFQITMATK